MASGPTADILGQDHLCPKSAKTIDDAVINL